MFALLPICLARMLAAILDSDHNACAVQMYTCLLAPVFAVISSRVSRVTLINNNSVKSWKSNRLHVRNLKGFNFLISISVDPHFEYSPHKSLASSTLSRDRVELVDVTPKLVSTTYNNNGNFIDIKK